MGQQQRQTNLRLQTKARGWAARLAFGFIFLLGFLAAALLGVIVCTFTQ